ncbi:hypothetical protein WJX72_012309 [[Myrmecia] bisecta]|uniref:Protein transport protein sec16 n=1 Tax=[Myrmecia] bisecta TaxID=41462 RepID=A0AAW1Q8V5_9CHLO
MIGPPVSLGNTPKQIPFAQASFTSVTGSLFGGASPAAGDKDASSFFDSFGAGSPEQQATTWGQQPAATQSLYGSPATIAEGMRTPDGQPPIALVAFGFGGRVFVMKPRSSRAPSSPGYGVQLQDDSSYLHSPLTLGPLQAYRMASLAADLGAQQQQGAHMQGGIMDDTRLVLSRFPGPLTANVSRDKVVKFVEERVELVAEEEAWCQRPDTLRLLWALLRILCMHQGHLRTPPAAAAKGKEETTAEMQLGKLLVPDNPQALGGWMGSGAAGVLTGQASEAAMQAAALEMQQLLMTGQRAEALKVAMAGGLWGPALLLARHCGDKAFTEAAAQMAEHVMAAGSPLWALSLLLAGKPDLVHQAKAVEDTAGGASAEGGVPMVAAFGGSEAAALTAGSSTSGSATLLAEWRENLAILGANRTAGDEAVIAKLGDRLWSERGEVEAAQLCYLVAGGALQFYEPASRLCLAGADHRGRPRSYASLATLQRTEVFEWAKLSGSPAYGTHTISLLPYKVLYAARLAEYGLISEAVQYCTVVQSVLAAIGKLPAGLLVCRALVNDLSERLNVHAAAYAISVSSGPGGSVLGSVGRWLDRGINKLIGGGDLSAATPPGSGPNSAGSEGSDTEGRRMRSSASMSGSMAGSPRAAMHKRSSSAAELMTSEPTSNKPPAADKRRATGPSSTGSASASRQPSLKSLLSKVSGLGSFLGSGPSDASAEGSGRKTQAKLGQENKFYYDAKLKMWREEGVDTIPETRPPPPPPTNFAPVAAAAAPGTMTSPFSQAANGPTQSPSPGNSGPTSASSVTLLPSPASSVGPPSANRFAAPRGRGVRSRYVDTFNPGGGGAPANSGVMPPPPLPKATAGSMMALRMLLASH